MAHKHRKRAALWLGVFCVLAVSVAVTQADDGDTREQVRELMQQNQTLQEQLKRQKEMIDLLTKQVSEIQEGNAHQSRKMEDLQLEMKDASVQSKSSGGYTGNVRISGEGGVGFFASGSEGMYPHNEFRIDEARLFLEGPVWDPGKVYFYTEIDMATREEPDVQLRLGEAYLDFESLSRFWTYEHLLNARIGRFYAPFGEEYQRRYAIDNPLISHSLSDLWSLDEGLQVYGSAGKFAYATAVQKGGIPDTADFDADKAVAGRIGFDPKPWLHLSASAMRTGDLDVAGDRMSAMWFSSAFFRSIGSPATTTFHANLFEGDVEFYVPHGHLQAFGGYIDYGDNDPAGNNHRDVYYYTVEAVHDVLPKFYVAARFNQIFANHGFPIVGNGNFGRYFFGPLTEEIWRLSLGLGYRFSPNLIFKGEYSFEGGRQVNGDARNHEDLFAVEGAYRF